MNQTSGQNPNHTGLTEDTIGDRAGKMTLAEFEQRLQSTGFFDAESGEINSDPRLQAFLTENPDSAALVRDLQYIAVAAKNLLASDGDTEPSDTVWNNIQSELRSELNLSGTLAASPEPAE